MAETLRNLVKPRREPVPEVDLDYLFDRLFPRILPEADQRDRTDNAIQKRQGYVVGREGRGKDNVAKWLTNPPAERYGEKRLAVDMADTTDFGFLMRTKWQQRRDIYFKIANDATQVGISDSDIHLFTKSRHEMETQTGFRSGLIVTVMLCHRLHSTPAAIHNIGYEFLFILSAPERNSWDWRYVRNLVGESALLELAKRDMEGQLDPTGAKKGWMLVVYEDQFLGITKIPKSGWAVEPREIQAPPKPEPEPEIPRTTRRLGVPMFPPPAPFNERLLMAFAVLLPWFGISLGVFYGQVDALMLTAGVVSLFLSGAWAILRFRRWRKSRGKKR